MADCERALGRPERALALATSPAVAKLVAGAAGRDDHRRGRRAPRPRRDRRRAAHAGERPAAAPSRAEHWVVRLRYAYADTLRGRRPPRRRARVVPPHRRRSTATRSPTPRSASRSSRRAAPGPTPDGAVPAGRPGRAAVPSRGDLAVLHRTTVGGGPPARGWDTLCHQEVVGHDPGDEGASRRAEGGDARAAVTVAGENSVLLRGRVSDGARASVSCPAGASIVTFRVTVPAERDGDDQGVATDRGLARLRRLGRRAAAHGRPRGRWTTRWRWRAPCGGGSTAAGRAPAPGSRSRCCARSGSPDVAAPELRPLSCAAELRRRGCDTLRPW